MEITTSLDSIDKTPGRAYAYPSGEMPLHTLAPHAESIRRPTHCCVCAKHENIPISILEVQVGDALLNGLELILLGLQIGPSVFYHLGRRLCDKKKKGDENSKRTRKQMSGTA